MNRNHFLFLVILLLAGIALYGQQGKVTGIYPAANVTGVPSGSVLEITLSAAVDTQGLGSNLFHVFGTNSGPVQGTVKYSGSERKFTFKPVRKFFAGEVIKVGAGPFKLTGGQTIKAYHWQFTVQVPKKTKPFFKKTSVIAHQSETPMFLTDIYGSGNLDLISSKGTVIRGDGHGKFYGSQNNSAYKDVSAVADLNNDGITDLICCNFLYRAPKVFLGTGNGNYTEIPYPDSCGIIYDVGDVNGDNIDDLITKYAKIAFDTNQFIRVYSGNGKGQFRGDLYETPIICDAALLTLADVNNDGILDLVVSNRGYTSYPDVSPQGLQVYLNDGDGHFTLKQSIKIAGVHDYNLAVQDMNHDGILDVVFFSTAFGFRWFTGNGDGTFAYISNWIWGREKAGSMLVADINGDDLPDIIHDNCVVAPEAGDSAEVSNSFFLNNYEDPFNYQHQFSQFLGLMRDSVGGDGVLGDIDGDGAMDLVAGCYTFTTIFINSDSTFAVREKTPQRGYVLEQNYPNPFNPVTTIRYRVGQSGPVHVIIYDELGRIVAEPVHAVQAAGEYQVTWNAASYGSGVYFYTIQAGSYSEAKKMLLLK
ncbi:MAG: FG-GAP-like repeat-containing protein [Ignavibacteria bacterium]|nr:FG-GAP-like repeat-containing protein [Ignavibacteria bacterium]